MVTILVLLATVYVKSINKSSNFLPDSQLRYNLKMNPKPLEIPTLTVCGGKIKDPSQFPMAIFEGKEVYFCTKACLRAFEGDPVRFMAGEIEHPLEDD